LLAGRPIKQVPALRRRCLVSSRAGRWGLHAGLLGLALLAGACATSPVGTPHKTDTFALPDLNSTRLGKIFEPVAAKHLGFSGVDLVSSGREAFEVRFGLAHLAEKTIDAQYYLWAPDSSGLRMLSALLDAADRGVRVRVLLDDLNFAGMDFDLAVLNAYPNVEIRLFNPFTYRNDRLLDVFTDFNRVNHRMHDKIFVVDNTVAVVGGRNIGDEYFSANPISDFRDLDLVAGGPVVRAASANFDAFWNSPWAVSIHALEREKITRDQGRQLLAGLARKIAADKSFPFSTETDPARLSHIVGTLLARFTWAPAILLADKPDKPQTSAPGVLDQLRADLGKSLSKELLIESAYFVPAGNVADTLCRLSGRGVRVTVLTNSLESTDVPSVFAVYSKYRVQLLRCGIELHELRAAANFLRRWTWLTFNSQAELHTKTYVFDQSKVMIGSFNMDPRSATLNAEDALLVDSPVLAAKVAKFIEAGMAPDNSYEVRLGNNGEMAWYFRDNGQYLSFDREPGENLWGYVTQGILSALPIDNLQ
jgi:putative cardiolipin synthase